jgi:sugar O-acyltransferase (sialic acid O-acetyltransferase NeuD family)
MKTKIDEIIIAGFSEGSLPMITEAANLQYGCSRFRIIRNIDYQEYSKQFIHSDFEYSLEHIDSIQKKIEGPIPVHFGVNHAHIRPVLFQEFRDKLGFLKDHYISVLHPTAVVSPASISEHGLFMEPLTVLSAFAKVGFGVCIKRNSSVGHHNVLEDYVCISPGVTLSGFVRVGEGTEIGSGTTVLHEVSIGRHCMIGAGSVVTKDIPDGMLAYGNPCKVIRFNDRWKNLE